MLWAVVFGWVDKRAQVSASHGGELGSERRGGIHERINVSSRDGRDRHWGRGAAVAK